MSECVKESVMQAFFDAELSPEKMERVRFHLGSCAICSELAQMVEAENSILDEAFEPEFSLAVPSEILRSRIDNAIVASRMETVELESRSGFFNRLSDLTAGLFAARWSYAGAFAVLTVCIAAGLAYNFVRVPVDPRTSASIPPVKGMGDMAGRAVVADFLAGKFNGTDTNTPLEPISPTVALVRVKRAPVAPRNIIARNSPNQPLPGEVGYLKAIATLTGAIEASGESSLKPSVRADYLRNMAVVDHAIDATKKTARQYPQDKDAVAFLYSSYQSKVDLLNAVADQSLLAAR
jgi:hypothetical protein